MPDSTDAGQRPQSVDVSAAPQDSLPRNVRILGWASLLNDTASEMIFPLLPTFLLTVLGGNRFYLGVIEGAADSIASLVKLWSGGRSDQVGKRKGFVVFGYSVAALSRPLIGLVLTPWQLFFLRVADRIGKGIRTSPRDALIADSADPSIHGSSFGFHRAMDHLGAAIGPLIAAAFLFLWPGRLRTLFLAAIVPGALVLVLLLAGLREAPKREKPKERLQLTMAPFDGNFRRFLLALSIFTLGNSSDAFLLVRAAELGVSTAMLPILWCVFHVAKSAGNYSLGTAVDRFGSKRLLIVGWSVYAAVYLGFGAATDAWQAWVLFLCYAAYYGLTEPAERTLVARLAGSERKGLAYGWYHFAIGVATLPASLTFGALYQFFGPAIAFGWGAALATVAAALVLSGKEPAKSETD